MPEPDLLPLSERVYALTGRVNAAIVVGEEREAVLVDTGGDKDFGRRVKKACERLGVRPVAVLNTHAHADHFGGNAYLLGQYELRVYAPPIEAALMNAPYLEPVYLMSGAKPLPELTTKWLQAPPSPVHEALGPGVLELCGVRLDVLDSSGHAHRQVSVAVGGVLLAADALFGTEVLARYPLPFAQDVGGQVSSAERLQGVAAEVTLPGHGAPSADLPALIEANLAAFERASEAVAAACTGVGSEAVLAAACRALGVAVDDLPRYYLNLCVVTAHLSHLRETGRVTLELADNALRWHAS